MTFVVYNNPPQECDISFNNKSQITLYSISDQKSVANQFNLELPFEKILKKCNIQQFRLSFYESEIDAKLEINYLKKPLIYKTAVSKKIFVRLENKYSGFVHIMDLNIKIK